MLLNLNLDEKFHPVLVDFVLQYYFVSILTVWHSSVWDKLAFVWHYLLLIVDVFELVYDRFVESNCMCVHNFRSIVVSYSPLGL